MGAGQSCSTQQLTLVWTHGLGGQGLGKQQLAQGKSKRHTQRSQHQQQRGFPWWSEGSRLFPKHRLPVFSYKSLFWMLPRYCHSCSMITGRGEPDHRAKVKERWDDVHHEEHTRGRASAHAPGRSRSCSRPPPWPSCQHMGPSSCIPPVCPLF